MQVVINKSCHEVRNVLNYFLALNREIFIIECPALACLLKSKGWFIVCGVEIGLARVNTFPDFRDEFLVADDLIDQRAQLLF